MNDQTLPKPTAPNNTNNSSNINPNLPQVVASVPKPALPDPVAKPAYKPTNFSNANNSSTNAPSLNKPPQGVPVMGNKPVGLPPIPAPPKPQAVQASPISSAPKTNPAPQVSVVGTMPKLPSLPNLPNVPKPPAPVMTPSSTQPKAQAMAQDIPIMANKPTSMPSLPNLPKPPQAPKQPSISMPKITAVPQASASPMPALNAVPPMPTPPTPTPAPAVSAPVANPAMVKAPMPNQVPSMNAVQSMPSSALSPTQGMPTTKLPSLNSAPPTSATANPTAVVNSAPTSTSTTTTTSTSTQVAAPKRSFMSYLPFIFGGFLIVGILAFFGIRFFSASDSVSVAENTSQTSTNNSGNTNTGTTGTNANAGRTEVPTTQTAITYWGLFESNDLMQAVIKDFESKNPSIKVNYVQQSYRDYRERLSTAITGGTGPDLFRFHASWVPMLKTSLSPIPSSVITAKDMKDNFYPAVTEQLSSGGQYVGVPMMYDGLALYYNEDILKAANETIPSTWMDLQKLAQKLTIRSANGVERGGLAIGNSINVEHYPEILALLMMQNGADLTKPNSPQVRDALLYYTSFMTKDPVWSEKLPSSTVAFSRGEVAMMFAPSWRAHEIQALNPDLKFGVAKLPQLSEEKVAYASYWAEGLNPNSKNKDAAAKFLAHLVNDETLKTFYSEASKVRGFGEIYPKVSMASLLSENKVAVPILEDAVHAKAWYLNSFTHDNGLNDQLIGYYKVAIDSFSKGSDTEGALTTLDKGVTQVLKQYGLVK